MTKCGRFGPTAAHFDYSPQTIRASVRRSLERLHTNYLDTVYLHDVEFVCSHVQPRSSGNHMLALSSEKSEYGLLEGQEAKVWGPGDQIILDAIAELRKMKEEGIVKHVGITGRSVFLPIKRSQLSRLYSGYPLPVLLRIALLIFHTPPFEPLDVLLSYSHLNLQNDTFTTFLPHFRDRARVSQFVTASPINMGLLTPSPPQWHPAPPIVRDAARKAHETCLEESWPGGGLPNVALGFAYRKAHEQDLPTVVGLSNPGEVHDNVKIWRELVQGSAETLKDGMVVEDRILSAFQEVQGWSWASP